MNALTTYRKLLLLAFGVWLAFACVLTMRAGVLNELVSKRPLIERVAPRWIIDSIEQKVKLHNYENNRDHR
jgi:hypothetical protein